LKRCTLVCDTAAGVLACDLELPEEATIGAALQAARAKLADATVDWEHVATGVYGTVLGRSHVWSDGDRVEVYRALQLDPRARRRQRAAKSARVRPASRIR